MSGRSRSSNASEGKRVDESAKVLETFVVDKKDRDFRTPEILKKFREFAFLVNFGIYKTSVVIVM